ncbi:MAG: Holliday junction branch migration protein RuvA [Bacteroidales bacterium]|nr:Holliday junction branch migration protein RuvA [Bacteroidales bacterium]
MYEYFKGKLSQLEPTQAVVECGGVGYLLEITLNTYEALRRSQTDVVCLYAHHVVREDAQQLYGFSDLAERSMFRLLVSISGVGNQTARVILSSLTVDELRNAISTGDARRVQQVKGIGAKTAQRIVLELADKMAGTVATGGAATGRAPERDEAITALITLGYAKAAVEKLLLSEQWVRPDGSAMSVEEIIKEALHRL